MSHQKIGNYRVLKEVGKGVLGTIYSVEHVFLKKKYALRVLPHELTQIDGFEQQFEKEISTYVGLSSPFVTTIVDVSKHDELFCIITELVEDSYGESLSLSRFLSCRPKKLSEAAVFSIIEQIARGVQDIHAQGLIHGGLTLSNILLSSHESESFELQLTNIGIQNLLGDGAIIAKSYQVMAESLSFDFEPFSKAYTFTGLDDEKYGKLNTAFLENYHSIAPERKIDISKKTRTKKNDIYALGVIAYFLLFRNYPMGSIKNPLASLSENEYNWSLFLDRTLAIDAQDRPQTVEEAFSLLTLKAKKNEEVVSASALNDLDVTAKLSPATAKVSCEAYAVTNASSAKRSVPPTKQPYDPDPAAIFKKDLSPVAHYTPKVHDDIDTSPIQTEMVSIPEGEYYRGSNDGSRDERPYHKVHTDAFSIDIHPVTNDQFIRFLETIGGEKDAANNDVLRIRESRIKRNSGKYIIESGYSMHPVVGVSWYGAKAYAEWIGKRLPSEAEWEIASRSLQSDILYPSGDNIERSQANFFSSDTMDVKSFAPNSLGLYDVAGNVYEWCEDWYEYNYYEESSNEPYNPKGPHQGVYRVLRGGCWKSLKEDLRCSHRHRNNPQAMNKTYGFRCAK